MSIVIDYGSIRLLYMILIWEDERTHRTKAYINKNDCSISQLEGNIQSRADVTMMKWQTTLESVSLTNMQNKLLP